ncbi:MAG: hypothetical protein JXA21_08540, partial [Anaerolineae bacterium]|nr:hypothetical protein [Anaerolineae bacterium]
MYRSHNLFRTFCILAAGLTLLVLWGTQLPEYAFGIAETPEDVVQSAWRKAQTVGVYNFTTELAQTTYPAPALVNVGRSSWQETLYINGQMDMPAHAMTMRLWNNGGNVLTGQSGVEVRIEDGQAYGRAIGEETWREMDDFSGAFAPGGDLTAYLAGAKNTREITEASTDVTPLIRKYAFDIDGPDFANYMRDQLERYMQESGE